MQSINRAATSPLILAALFGTTLACIGLSIWAVADGRGVGSVAPS